MDVSKIQQMIIAHKFHPFDLKQFVKIWDAIQQDGISIEDVRSYAEDETMVGRLGKPSLCAKCGHPLMFFRVNNHPTNQVGGEFKYQLRCSHCDFEAFTETTKEFKAFVKKDEL
jgi:hypothetical protein